MSRMMGSLNAAISDNGSGVLCLWRITDQVCLGQNGLFWHELCESF